MNISLKNAIKSWLWNPLFSHFFLFHWDRQMAVLFTETELLSDVWLYCCLRAVLPHSLETCVLDLLLASSTHHWAECLNPVYQILHHKCCLFLEKKQSVVVTLIIFWDRRRMRDFDSCYDLASTSRPEKWSQHRSAKNILWRKWMKEFIIWSSAEEFLSLKKKWIVSNVLL